MKRTKHLVVILLLVLGVAILFWPKAEPEFIIMSEESMSEDLKNCLLLISSNYYTGWDKECERLGKEVECKISSEVDNELLAIKEKDKIRCYKMYYQ